MKNFTFLTNLRNSNQVMTRLRPGNNQVKTTLRFIAILTMLLTLGVGNAWGDSYTITFSNSAGSATAISSSVGASTTIASAGRTYVTSTPYTVNSGNCYYGGDGSNNIRIGKSGNDASLSIALSASGQVAATTIVVNCMKMSGNKNTSATLSVNGASAQSAPASANNLTFTINDDITAITLSSTKAVFIYSITVNTGGGASVSTPTFSVAEGTYNSNQSVTISCATAGSTIYYTTNGTTPTSSSTAYSSAVSISSTTTLKAIAIKSGTSSSVASATYTLKCATPTFSPAAGTYGAVQSVSISTTYGTNIYYTTDGTTPTTSSTPYTSTISVSSTQTIKAIASKSGCSDSDEGSAAYTINIPYTVSFNTGTGNPTVSSRTEASAGAGITLPSGPTPACSGDGWSFAGWGYESCDDESTEPTLYIAGNKYYPESNETLYAVYVKGKTASTNYKLISDAAQIVSGENYVIAAYYNSNDYAITAEIQSSYYIKQTAVTVTENVISSPGAKIIWQLTNEGGSNVSLYNSNQSKYLYVYASSSYRNLGLYASKKQFTMTEEREAGYASTFAFKSTDYTTYYINYDASHTDFGTKTSSDENLYLYKRQYTGTYESNPTCCTDPGLAYGTGSVTKTYGEGAFTNPLTNSHSVGVTYALSSVSPAGCVSINASTGQVTINAAGSATVTASFAGNSTYCADEASYTLTVNKANISPTLSYESGTLVIGNNSSSPTVGGNSGSGTVTYAITTESTSGVVTLNTSTGVVTAAKEGTATITATIPATTNYNGGSATANFTVTCGAPSSVDISGNYQFYPGETISLTATPTGGAGTPVTYQWKKDGVNIVGATSATYTKNNATVADAGSYTCTVQYGSNCATTSSAFKLKCMQFYLKTSGGADISNHALTKVDATHATLSLSLTGGTTYKFRVTDGCGDWYGNSGEMTSSNCTNWAMDADADCRVTTSIKSATYVFNFDFSGGLLGSEMKVSVVYPSSNQASGKVIYWDNEVNKWNGSKLWYRIGKSTHNSNTQLSKVAGTANFYSVTTSEYNGFEYWHIANNQGQGTGNIFWTKDNSGSGLEITNAMGFEGAPVTDATVTVTPTTTHSTGGSSANNNCEFYTYSITSGVKSYTVTSSATNCTVAMEKYNNDAGSSTTALASGGTVMPTQYVKVTVTPNTGYQFSSVSVTNGTTVTAAAAGTPGVYYITGNATVTATCTVKSCTVNFDKNSGTGGDASTTATYGSAMTTVTAPTRTGYTFDGYWDAETDNDGSGTQYYLANGTSARDWDKDVTADQMLYAKWNAKQYTIELDREGAATGAESVTATYDAGTLAGWSAPSKTGYTFGGYWSDDNGTGTLVISTSGVLQNSVTISAVNWTDASGHWIKDGGVTVYAKWTAEQYTITYKDQGNVAYSGNKTAGVPTGAPTTHTYGAATALVNGVKDGYRFDGWFNDESCTVSAGSSIGATAKTADFTLYAKWTQVRTVTWSVNGSTWSSGVVEGNTHVISGEKVSALPTAPTKSDCDDSKVFVGWRATAIDGTSISEPSGIFTDVAGSPAIDADKTFYAVFADSNEETKHLTNSEIQTFHGADADHGTYAKGPFTLTSTDGNWYGVFATQNNSSTYTANIKSDNVTISGNATRPYLQSPTYSSNITRVTITHNCTTDRTLLICSSATANPADDKIATISITSGNKSGVSADISGSVTQIYLYSSSGAIMIKSIDVKIGTPSNYVTTCASCDENATYSNTTPTVSDIDCTGATLTMEDGLATVGADGCHVSDYGFVIGTSDNPAVGGDGVTKLQVGTSDPTIGADFSYDATGLTKGTRYYIRAYATNGNGTAYSTSTNFWTKNVSSIAITTAPTKTNYLVGETFDATGMVVTATMASGSTENVTSDVTYSSSALTAGTSQNFAINYTLCETAKSVNQVINVYTLTVTEGSNPTYGIASGSANIVSITGLGEHKTYTVTVTSSNATAVDNGDNTWTITNPTGNVAVRVDYAEAAQVKVYYKVDGVTVTGLTQDVYQSETTTLPTASELATAMTAQSMDIPDDDYPNFYGWSETEFPAQTAEPTIVTGTPTINAEKTYYAVYTNMNKKQILPSDFASSYATNEGAKTIDGLGYNIHDICLQSSKIQFRNTPGYLYSTSALSYIKKIEITGLDLIVNACSDNAGTLDGDAITPTGTAPYVYTFPASKQYFKIKGKGGTDKVSLIEIFYANTTVYYMTEFCATKVTLSHNSPEHGTVEFSRSSLATCGSDKNVSLTIIPDAGYKLTGWTVNTASGYADAKTTSPAVVTTNNNSAAQNITLTFAQDANNNYDVTATFGLMTVESWTWTHNSAAIPDPFNLYVGQTARFDVAYTPAGVDNSKKTYTRTKEDAYINWSGAQQATYSTISGRASTGENTTPVTFTHADGPTTKVNVKVLPLPLVHFGDIVHNVEFADVVATLSDNALSPTKTTPTHADFDGATKNTCEEEHLHLVGWIREDWPALVTYLNGGAQPSTDDITGAGNDGSGNAYFFAPGASINTQTFNGVTFYAVWAKVE